MRISHGIFILAALLAAAALQSCGKDHAFNRRTIKVKVTSAGTKGTVTTTKTLEASGAFTMDAYVSDEYFDPESETTLGAPGGSLYIDGHSTGGNVTLKANKWNIAPPSGSEDPYCWVAGVHTRFWAWHPVAADGRTITGPASPTADAFAFSYSIPEPADTDPDYDGDGTPDFGSGNSEDLVFAYAKESKGNDEDDATVSLTFRHALAQVCFCVSPDDGTFDKSLDIKTIAISNLKTSGNASFAVTDGEPGFIWSGLSGKRLFFNEYNANFRGTTVSGWTKGSYTDDGGVTHTLFNTDNVFFMIPQTVGDTGSDATSNMISVTFIFNGQEKVKAVPIAGEIAEEKGTEWLADHYYKYKIKATIVGRDIEMSATLVGWEDRDDKIFI